MRKGPERKTKTGDSEQLKTGVDIVELSDESVINEILAEAFGNAGRDKPETGAKSPKKSKQKHHRKRDKAAWEETLEDAPEEEPFGQTEPEEPEETAEMTPYYDKDAGMKESGELGAEIPEPPRALTRRELEALKRREKLNHAIGVAILLLLVACAAALLYFLLIIQHVSVSGNEDMSEQYILQSAGIETGKHIWLADYSGARERLMENPYIASVSFELKYPDTVCINIEERHAAAALIGLSSMAVIDENGYVLSIGTADTAGLLKVYGVGSSGYKVNEQLGDASDFASRTLIDIIAAVRRQSLGDVIESVDISNALSVYMVTFSGFTVQLGQPEDLDDKLEKLSIVLPYVTEMGYTGGVIDVSVRGDPVYSPQTSAQQAAALDYESGTATDLTQPQQPDSAEPANTSQTPAPED